MEDLRIEIDLLTKCLKNLEDFKNNAKDCDNVGDEEYYYIGNYAETLNDRLINLQSKLERLEEIA